MTRPRIRRLLAWALAAVGVAVVAVLGLRQFGADVLPGRPRVDLGATTPAVLDTVSVSGRTVRASLSGRVGEPGPGRTVWVIDGGDGFPVAFPDTVALRVGDRILVVGRLRGRGGRRWLDAEGWASVHGRAE